MTRPGTEPRSPTPLANTRLDLINISNSKASFLKVSLLILTFYTLGSVVYVFIQPLHKSRLRHKVISKRSLVFSFSWWSSLGWGCRIHQLHLCIGVQFSVLIWRKTASDNKVPVMLEHWRIQSTSSLPSLPGPLWIVAVARDKGPMDQIELHCILMLNWIVWNKTVYIYIYIYIYIYMYNGFGIK